MNAIHPMTPSPSAEVTLIQVLINDQTHRLNAPATLADAITALGIRPPFAAAVNLQFVPRSQHGTHALSDGDRVELIAPITGG
jgi:sulfur carrier protein